MKNDKKGTSTCPVGQEQFEKVKSVKKLVYLQYDYRHTDGKLFSTAAPNLRTARIRRDEWLEAKKNKKPIASKSCQELMQNATKEIHQLTIDRNVFYSIAKVYVKHIEDMSQYKKQPLENPEYVFAKLKIEEYENR